MGRSMPGLVLFPARSHAAVSLALVDEALPVHSRRHLRLIEPDGLGQRNSPRMQVRLPGEGQSPQHVGVNGGLAFLGPALPRWPAAAEPVRRDPGPEVHCRAIANPLPEA